MRASFEGFFVEGVHEGADSEKYCDRDDGDRKSDEKAVSGEEDEFKEIVGEGDEEGAGHDDDNRDEESSAEGVERARNPINEYEVDGESDENSGGGEFKMREIVDAGNNREGEGGDSNGDADRDGIFHDVSGEAIFDAIGVFFESEDEGGETDTGEVEERHFDWSEGVAEREKDEKNGEDGGVDGFGKEKSGGALEVVDGLTAFVDNAGDGGEVGI